MSKFFNKKYKRGFTLIEVLIYLFLLVILLAAIVNSTLLLAKNYRNVKAVRTIENSAISSMDRMVREIRNANGINGAQTNYGVNAGSLMLDTTNSSGANITLRFYLAGGKVMLDRNGSVVGPLTSSDANVSSLIFRHIATSTSEAVKIEMTIESGTSTPAYIQRKFYDTAVVRGTY